MSARRAIAKKEFLGVFKERTILLAVVIQIFVAGFSSFLVVGLSALVDPDALPASATPTVATNGTTPASIALRSEGVIVRVHPTDEAAVAAFRNGDADAALLVRDTGDPNLPVDVTLVLPDGDLAATLTIVQVKEALENYERELRTERSARLAFDPVYVDTNARAGSFGFVYALLVPLLVFLPVVLAGALSVDSLTEEVQRGTLPLLLVSPATVGDVVAGKLAANVAIAPILAVAWILILALNDLMVPFVGAVAIILLTTALSFIMGLVAAAIALATKDRNKAHVLYATILFFMLALSLALPVSPVNAVALFAAGSPNVGALGLVAGSVAVAAAGWFALSAFLKRPSEWMVGGTT